MNFSYWEKSEIFENLDYLIIGAGIVGSTTAFFLKAYQPLARILIIERGSLPSGASTKNAGFACFGSIGELMDDLDNLSLQEVIDTVKMRTDGLKLLRDLVPEEAMDYSHCGGHEVFFKEEDSSLFDHIQEGNDIVFEASGLKNTFQIKKDPCQTGFASDMIFNQYEGKLNPVKMIKYLHQKLMQKGVHIQFGINVEEINNNEVMVKSVHQKQNVLTARKVVVCTNAFAKRFIDTEDIVPARNIVLVSEEVPDLPLNGTFHHDKGYVYFRNIENRILIGGARNIDSKSETTDQFGENQKIISHLKDLTKKYICPTKSIKFNYQWSGIIATGASKQPIVKKINEGLYAAVRLGGMGVAIGSLTGRNAAKLVSEQ